MGHLPASERPRSCSLGTGPFVFPAWLRQRSSLLTPFIRLINGLRGYRAPAPIAAAKIRSAPRSNGRRAARKNDNDVEAWARRSVFVSLPAWLIDCFCRAAARHAGAAKGFAFEGRKHAGTGRFFSSKIATAAEKTPPIREETQNEVAYFDCIGAGGWLVRRKSGFCSAAAGGPGRAGSPNYAARPECHSREDAVQYSLRHADHLGASARRWLRRRSTRPPSAAGR